MEIANCRGSQTLGTGCGRCAKCDAEKETQMQLRNRRTIIAWVVCATPEHGWFAVEVVEKSDAADCVYGYPSFDPYTVTFFRTNKVVLDCADFGAAIRAVHRAKEKEQELRPMWIAAHEHVLRVTQIMQDATMKAAKNDK